MSAVTGARDMGTSVATWCRLDSGQAGAVGSVVHEAKVFCVYTVRRQEERPM